MTTKAKNDFSQGKIFKKEPSCDHEEGDIYIGLTTKKYLSRRMVQNKYCYNSWKILKTVCPTRSCKIFENYGFDNCQIILFQNVNATHYNDLVSSSLKSVNKEISMRSKKEYREVNKEIVREKKRI